MALSVVILSLLLSIQLSSLVVALTFYNSDICNVYSAPYGTPIDIHITCSVYHYDSFSCPNNTFFHEWKATTCDQRYHSQCQPLNCHGFVGMNLTYECSFEGARLYRYKNGEYQYLNGSSVNYGLLLPEHAGLYECRNGTTGAVHSQNITVNEEIRIGSTNCEEFSPSIQQNMCCSNGGFLTASESYNFAVYANPADNVSVTIEQIEWLADNEARSDVDLGQYTQQNKTNPTIWKAGFRYMPYKVTNKDSNIIILITASTANYSYSVSVILHISAIKTDFKIENTSLPLNTTVSAGQDAIFQCTYTYANIQDASEFLIKIDYPISAVSGNTTTIETCSIYLSLSTPYNYTSDNCTMPPVKKVVTVSNSISSVVEYTLRIPKVTVDLSGSIVSCSVVKFFKPHHLQWRTSAYLTVIDPVILTAELSTSAIVVVMLPVIVVMVYLIRKCRQRINQNKHSYRHTRLCESQSTLCDIESDGALCVQISEINGVPRNGLMVGEQVPGNDVKNNGQTGVYSQRLVDGRPSSPYQRDEPPDRTLELYDLSELTEFVVYISYTDATSEWVRNELKPLIELLHPVIRVNIHEDSMIPGFSVSGERHRLILGADKIVIVVSSDYASSEWCVYELEHAIHQKPALCNGRVIPILTEISNPLPKIIHGVVCLYKDENDFNGRLRQAIFKKPHSVL